MKLPNLAAPGPGSCLSSSLSCGVSMVNLVAGNGNVHSDWSMWKWNVRLLNAASVLPSLNAYFAQISLSPSLPGLACSNLDTYREPSEGTHVSARCWESSWMSSLAATIQSKTQDRLIKSISQTNWQGQEYTMILEICINRRESPWISGVLIMISKEMAYWFSIIVKLKMWRFFFCTIVF